MSWVSGRSISMTDEEFLLIRDLIYEHCGIYLPESIKYLVERRLRPRLPVHDLESFREYYRLLRYGRDRDHEMDEVAERITTNETYFFRGSSQLAAFSKEIIPALMERKRPGTGIRIWSAGCSSGEEAYTIAMLLNDIPGTERFRFDIFGNDISRKVLRIARDGVYRQSSFRETDRTYIDRYFTRNGESYRLGDEIRSRVQFGHINLMDQGSMALIANVDVIFCRNVMIYFSPDSRKRLLQSIYSKLKPCGYLIVGHSESLVNVSTDFELCPLQHDIVYRRPPLPGMEDCS